MRAVAWVGETYQTGSAWQLHLSIHAIHTRQLICQAWLLLAEIGAPTLVGSRNAPNGCWVQGEGTKA